jgi:hypothetical protein
MGREESNSSLDEGRILQATPLPRFHTRQTGFDFTAPDRLRTLCAAADPSRPCGDAADFVALRHTRINFSFIGGLGGMSASIPTRLGSKPVTSFNTWSKHAIVQLAKW